VLQQDRVSPRQHAALPACDLYWSPRRTQSIGWGRPFAAIWREESDRAKRRGAKMNEAGERIYRVGEPIDAEDARAHGWPSVGPCIAAIALAIAALPRGGIVELSLDVPDKVRIPRMPAR
jgi:hypothetical protein